ncbi:MAG: hypothetical protein GXO35_06410 [Gammaproteobacteria bacterium]|nr:hypothetical protein [Gammaproteobacteria bacterium]
MHKKGHITSLQPCHKAVDRDIWKVQFNLPNFDYKKYKNTQGVVLYAKEVETPNQKICLLDYEFRAKGEHTSPSF